MRRRGCLFGLLVLLALVGHLGYWYWPRLRPATPEASDLPARLFRAQAYDFCVWIPYPHQNVATVTRVLPDPEAFFAAAARLAGADAAFELPRFGPFALPPAREITVCADRRPAADTAAGDASSFRIAARVYPALSWIAKAAGRLAGNAWLSGGEVEQGGRKVRVAWQGTLWTVEAGSRREIPAARSSAPGSPAALAEVALKAPQSVFPAGLYFLTAAKGAVTLERDGGGARDRAGVPADLPIDLPQGRRPILLLASSGGGEIGGPPGALALYANVIHGSLELPGAAVFHSPSGRQRWSLPAQSLMDVVTGKLPRATVGGWGIVALDGDSLELAKSLAPALDRLAPREGPAGLRIGLWVDPPQALALATRVHKVLASLPFLDPERAETWQDAETVLTPLARCRRLAATSTVGPDGFVLRLSGCGR